MRKSRTKQRKDVQNYALAFIALTVIAAVAIGVFVWKSGAAASELNPISLCPKTGNRGHVILLVDKTDMLGFVQNRAFMQLVSEFANGKRVAEGELLSIFVLGSDFTASPDPVFEKCNPGDGSGKSEWTASVDKLKARFDEKFRKPIEEGVAKELVASTSSARSPIFEMLQIVALRFSKFSETKRSEKRLYVVSDMLHNTDSISFFGRTRPDFQKLSRTPVFAKLGADFQDVTVEMQILQYRPDLQGRELLEFWRDYFLAMRAKGVTHQVIPG